MVRRHAAHPPTTAVRLRAARFLAMLSCCPPSYAARLASQFHTRRWFSENQSFGLARKLDAFLEDVASLIQQAPYAQAHAMLRAFLTVVIEVREVADDSFGCLGDSC